jgi:hemerythrin-like domain-containing protein
MATMSMNKAIHGAVRRDLARFRTALAQFPDGDKSRAAALGRAWANFDDQLEHHHHGEHEIAWPALRELGVSQALLTTLDDEHDTMAAALARARGAMEVLSRTGTGSIAAVNAIAELESATVSHLLHEEAELEPVFLANAGSEVLKKMGREFGKVSPARGGRFFAWVLDGATPDERAAAVGSIPPPVLAIIGGVFGAPYRLRIAPVWH